MSQPMYFVMPEWQGSASSRAMRLTEGAALLREDLPVSARVDVPVPLEAGDALGTPVARLSSLLHARDAARALLSESTGTPIIVGGDCASSLPGLEAAVRRHGSENLAVLWCDAHPDLQHPSTSPSGAASGMTLRHALGDGSDDLRATHPISPDRIVMVGTRAQDPEEFTELERLGIAPLEAVHSEARLQEVRDRITGATHIYVHIDLDVIDPAEFGSVHSPVPFGLQVQELTTLLRDVLTVMPLAGASICEFAPASEANASDDLPTVLRILAALTSGSTGSAGAAR